MAPARPVTIPLGSLLFAGAICQASSLQPMTAGDAMGNETQMLEKDQFPWGKVGRLWFRGRGEELDEHDGLPPTPGCWMRMPSGCPKQRINTEAWRPDKWADEHAVGEAGCLERKGVWDSYCESGDAEMLYVDDDDAQNKQTSPQPATPMQAVQLGGPGRDAHAVQLGEKWPWTRGRRHRAAARAEAGPDAPAGGDPSRPAARPEAAAGGDHPRPGCYMRMASGCPNRPMKTQVWKHDTWAEVHDLDEAGCKARKRVWDRLCGAEDAAMSFVAKQ